MSAAVMVRAMQTAAWGGRPLAWESCGALLDRLPPDRDVVASLPAGGFLACMLGARVARDRLFLHASANRTPGTPQVDAQGDTGAVLDANDREPWQAGALPWPVCARPWPPTRRRRADTLYADSHAPGLMVLGGQDQAAILRGASRLLATRRPMLLLDFSAVTPAARAALWEDCVQACAKHDYAWQDALLSPCRATADRLAAVAALGHAAGIGLPAETVPASALPDGMAALLEPQDLAVAELAWDAPQARVTHHEAVRHGCAMRLDALPTQGFYPPETDGKGGLWRWTGPGPCAALTLPIPGPGPWRLRLDVVNWGVARVPAALRACIGGALLPVERQGDDFISFAPLAPPLFWSGAPLRVELATRRPPRASPNDPRCLGVCLSHAALTPL